MELIVRKGTINDLDDIARLEEECFNVPWSKESIRNELLNNDKALYIVGEILDKDIKRVVGYIGIWEILDEGHIMNVCVEKNYRGHNIASDILETMIEVTSKMGIKRWTLEVRKSNYPAIGLYKKYGFVEAGIRRGYYEDNREDALIMWKGIDTKLN